MNKWLKVGLFALGGAMIAPSLGFDSRLGAGVAGFFAGGPIGGVAGYVAAPTLQGIVGGVTGSGAQVQGTIPYTG